MNTKSVSDSHRGADEMSVAVASSDPRVERQEARRLARRLQQNKRAQGYKIEEARRQIAGKLGMGPEAFRNIVIGRVKRIDSWVRGRLQELLVRELEAEIGRLQHELEMARQGGSHLASQHVSEIETYLAKARSLLDGGAR